MDALKEPVTLGSFKRCLNSLPNGAKGLNETYNQAMKRIDGQGEERQELARRILYWIVYTRRTLTIAELIDALAISYDLGGSKLDHDLRPEVDDIDSLCAGLVSADTNAGIVRLVHKTTQEYFTNVNAFPDAHRQILKVCITFLCYNEIWNTGPRNTREPRSQGHTGQNTKNICEAVSPIGIYAIEEWHTHAAAMHDGWDEVQQFLFSPSKAIHVSTCMRYLLHVEQRKRPPTYLECHGIHLVAYLGLHKLMDRLVHFGEAVDTKDSEGNTPLYYAATCGHLKSVRFLLWLQPSPDKSFDCAFCFSESVNKKGLWKSLCIAVVGGHLQVVEEFINLHGMDETARRVISTLQKHPLNPLDAAARHGHTDILALLLKRWGSWISDAFQDWAVGALAVAVEGACVSTVRLILEKRKEHACIYNAIYGKIHEKWILQMTRNKNIIEMLAYCYLEDQRWEEYDFGLLLFHQSAVVGLERIVKQLIPRVSQNHNLVAPAHVHELYSTMMIASQHRHTTILDLIFDNFHIDPYLDWMDGSFMYNAIFGNQTEIFARLTSLSSLKPSYSDQWNVLTEAMKAGADIWQWRSFPVDSNQNEPEQYTLFANILSGKRGLSIDIRNDSGHTPLIKAIMTGFNGVDFLRKQGVDLNERDQCGLSALSHAAIKYSQRFYFLEDLRKMRATNFPLFCLLEMPEVDITSKDNEGHTALWWAIRSIDTYFEDEKDQEEPDICAQDKAVEMLLKKGSVVPDDESMKLIAKRLQGDGLTMSDTWPEEFLQEITEMYKRIEKMMQDKLASVQSAQVSERSTT
jgi:ankyrin repeat protein